MYGVLSKVSSENKSEKCEICGKILIEILIVKETQSIKCIVYKCCTCGVKKFVFSILPSEQIRNLSPFTKLVDQAVKQPLHYFTIIKNQVPIKRELIV